MSYLNISAGSEEIFIQAESEIDLRTVSLGVRAAISDVILRTVSDERVEFLKASTRQKSHSFDVEGNHGSISFIARSSYQKAVITAIGTALRNERSRTQES